MGKIKVYKRLKGCTKLLSLPDNAKKELNFYSLSQNKSFHSLQGSFLILTTSSTQVKTLHMDLCWDYFHSSLQAKNSKLTMLAFKKNLTHPHSNQPKPSPVSKSSTQICACSFSLTSRPGSCVHKPISCHCSLNEAKLHTFLLA